MAIQFNLLPWREAKRQKQLKITKTILLLAVVLGFIISAGLYVWETARLSDYNNALALVTEKNNILRSQLKEKQALDELKTTLNKQINAIEALQADRASVTHMIEELSLANTQALFLTEFSLTNGQVKIAGIAENDKQISGFMTALKKSQWYQAPQLVNIIAEPQLGDEIKKFTITSRLLLPSSQQQGN